MATQGVQATLTTTVLGSTAEGPLVEAALSRLTEASCSWPLAAFRTPDCANWHGPLLLPIGRSHKARALDTKYMLNEVTAMPSSLVAVEKVQIRESLPILRLTISGTRCHGRLESTGKAVCFSATAQQRSNST